MMDTLGPKNVLDYAKRFGFEEDFPPYLPIALGAGDATLLEVTSAYTVFPNQGVRMKPFAVLKVKDRDGNLLEENRGEPSDVIRADTAYVMTNLLRGVARCAAPAPRRRDGRDWPLAGKTGTVDDNTDAWFIGFDPDITVGVWIGLRREEVARRRRAGRVRRAADLDGLHEGLHRRAARTRRSRRSSRRRATSCSCRSTRRPARCCRPIRPGRSSRRSSPARSPAPNSFNRPQ